MSEPTTLLIGATGPTGQAFLRSAAQAGLPVRALARHPDRLNDTQRHGAEVVQGDVLDPASLSHALVGITTVVSLLGTPLSLQPVTLLSTGTRHLVNAMQTKGTPRLLCVTGMGAGDSRGHGGWLYDRVLLPLLLGRIYADKDRQEAVVRASALDWVLVRPARLTDTPAQGRYRRITHWSGAARMTRIARADVANFLLGELRAPTLHRTAVNLSD